MTEDVLNSISGDDFVERRSSVRKPVGFRVSLYYDRLGLLSCKTCNLSIEGMLLDTGRVRLTENTHVEIVLTHLMQDYNDPIRLLAHVSRVDECFAALTFQNLEIGTFRRLKSLLSDTA